jgi:polyisoprenyl-teichoic acid--peptidoglycan teichoic acid transferase
MLSDDWSDRSVQTPADSLLAFMVDPNDSGAIEPSARQQVPAAAHPFDAALDDAAARMASPFTDVDDGDPPRDSPVTGDADQPIAAAAGRRRDPGAAGVILLPGVALWRRTPILGAVLVISGVIAPATALIMTVQHRDDPIGLFTRPNILRYVSLVAMSAVFSRLIAVWLTADRLRDPRARRSMQITGSLVVTLLAIPLGATLVIANKANGVVQQIFQDSPGAGIVSVPAFVDPLAGEFHTVLLMGSDEGSDRLGLRTDTMIIALVHEATGRTALVSVPRNLTGVRFPPGTPLADRYPDGFEDDEGGLINALYITVENDAQLKAAYETDAMPAGVHALLQGLTYSLGVTIDDYALINSCGFVKVVDVLGGIVIDIDKKLPMPGKLRCSNYHLPATIGPGETYMDGTKALGYVRSRLGDSDYQRMERQRLLLQTIVDEVGLDDLLLRFDELASAVEDNVRTSMTLTEARTLLAVLQTEDGFTSVGLSPPLVEPGHPDYVAVKALLQQIRTALADGTELDLPTETTP